MIANNVGSIPGSSPMLRALQTAEGWTALERLARPRRSSARLIMLRDCCLALDKISERFVPIARTFACESFGAARRLQVDPGKREWRENQDKRREGERIPVRRRRQQSDALFRGARRQTSPSPSDTVSIARRSPNGRRGSSFPTREWARRIPAQAFSRSAMKRSFSLTGGAPASRSMTPI
jgi:hypothetical protein